MESSLKRYSLTLHTLCLNVDVSFENETVALEVVIKINYSIIIISPTGGVREFKLPLIENCSMSLSIFGHRTRLVVR
jgi:hypothetical protein